MEKLSTFFILMKCIFPENWAVLHFANLGKKEKSFYMLWRSCLLITRMNGSKDTLFGFVFLRFSYIIIIYFAASPHFIIPKYNRERKKKKPSKIPPSSWIFPWKFKLKIFTFCFSLVHLRKLYTELKFFVCLFVCLFVSFFNGPFRKNKLLWQS